MKRILLGSTALAASLVSGAAMAEEPIKLSLGGYFRAYGIYQDSDVPGLRSTYLGQEGRVSLSGSTILDNGVTVGVYTQFRAGENGDLNRTSGFIRRAYGFFEGSFGRVELGNADGAALVMGYASPDPAPSAGVNSPNFYANPPVRSIGIATVPNLAGALGSTPTTYQNWDAQNTKVSYFTPRVAGFQFGMSFTPEGCQTSPTAGGDSCPSHGQAALDNTIGQQSEVWQLGLNYANTFGEMDVGLSGTFVSGTLEGQIPIGSFGPGTGVDALTDRQSYSLGGNLGWRGFTLGGSYLHDNAGIENVDVDAWDIGLKYQTGPWTAGVQYIESARSNPLGSSGVGGFGGEDSVNALRLGAGYALGPGINLGIGYQMWSWDSTLPSRSPLGLPATSGKADANMILLGTVLNF